jgi:hypothetical protein
MNQSRLAAAKIDMRWDINGPTYFFVGALPPSPFFLGFPPRFFDEPLAFKFLAKLCCID